MPNKIEFEYTGKITGYKRAMQVFKNGRRIGIQNKQYKAFKDNFQKTAKDAGIKKLKGPLKINKAIFVLPPSKYSNLNKKQDKIDFIISIDKTFKLDNLLALKNDELNTIIKSLCLTNRVLPTSKQQGDIDNYLKAILDSLNKIGFEDDAQVCMVNGLQKLYGEKSKIILEIEEMEV